MIFTVLHWFLLHIIEIYRGKPQNEQLIVSFSSFSWVVVCLIGVLLFNPTLFNAQFLRPYFITS